MRTLGLPLALVLLAAPAAAQDACLSGASLLTDQRALASLREETETACPCDGAPSRKAYRACARGVVGGALDEGALRAECRRTAMLTVKGAVCGTSRVACGRFRAGRSVPVSCRVRPPRRCTDGPYDTTACAAETHCADVVEWTAGTCIDPRQPGPFVPGVRVVTFTKPSVVEPTQSRSLETAIWYPAPSGSGTPGGPYAAVANAPLDAGAGPHPLLLFSHGSCGYPAQSTFLLALLASHGFIVAAPPHPGNTLAEFPSCGALPSLVASLQERPQDVIHVTNELLAANLDPASPFFAAIDPARVGMSGHSFGGLTTFLAVALDPRFRVAVPLAAAASGNDALGVPSLMMLGQIDSAIDNDENRAAFANGVAPRYLVEILNAGHYAFSNGCFPGPDCAFPITLSQPEAHAVVQRWVLPFLKVHLAGDPTFAPFLVAPAPPGVLLTAVP